MPMSVTARRNAALVDALIDLVGCLRARRYEGIRDSLWRTLLEEGEIFAGHLVLHVLTKESYLLSALKKDVPGSARLVGRLESEHSLFRAQAEDILGTVAEGDSVKALEQANDLLRSLLDHVRREERELRALSGRLKGPDRTTMRALLRSYDGTAVLPHGGRRLHRGEAAGSARKRRPKGRRHKAVRGRSRADDRQFSPEGSTGPKTSLRRPAVRSTDRPSGP